MEGIQPIGIAIAFLVFGALFVLQNAFGSRPSGSQFSGRNTSSSQAAASQRSLDRETYSTKNRPTRIKTASKSQSAQNGTSAFQESDGIKQAMQEKIESYRGITRPHKPTRTQMGDQRVKLLLD